MNMSMSVFMSYKDLDVTNMVTIILLLQELHCLGMFSLPLQKERKKEKTFLGYCYTVAVLPNAGGRGNLALPRIFGY